MHQLDNKVYDSSSEFKVNKGLRQGDAKTPLLFNVVLEIAFRNFEVETEGTVVDRFFSDYGM